MTGSTNFHGEPVHLRGRLVVTLSYCLGFLALPSNLVSAMVIHLPSLQISSK